LKFLAAFGFAVTMKGFLDWSVFCTLMYCIYGVALLQEMDVACSASTPCIFDCWLLDLMLCNSLLRMIIGLGLEL